MRKKVQNHSLVKTLRNLNMFQLVHKITRPVSKTCLDHIWCTHPERLHNPRVMSSGISDHLPLIVTRKFTRCPKNNKDQHTTITYRDIKGLNEKNLFHRCMRLPGTVPLCSRIPMMLLTPDRTCLMTLSMNTSV